MQGHCQNQNLVTLDSNAVQVTGHQVSPGTRFTRYARPDQWLPFSSRDNESCGLSCGCIIYNVYACNMHVCPKLVVTQTLRYLTRHCSVQSKQWPALFTLWLIIIPALFRPGACQKESIKAEPVQKSKLHNSALKVWHKIDRGIVIGYNIT